MLAQTTDLGSNNNTMASTMYDLLRKNNLARRSTDSEALEESGWDPKTMHVRCFCHKIALIVNAGLKTLSLETLPPGKTKESVLGFFPVLGRLVKEEEPETPEQKKQTNCTSPHLEDYDVASKSNYGNAGEEATGGAGESNAENDSDNLVSAALLDLEKHSRTTRLNSGPLRYFTIL
jgi:hypothetical protein